MGTLQSIRSVLSLLVAILTFPLGVPVFHLGFQPLSWLWPRRRHALVSAYMKLHSRAILAGLRLGGARFRWTGQVPTQGPVLVVMNHQSLIDILIAIQLSEPYTPAFVTRARYARFIPLVSPCVRGLHCPIIDPRRDSRGAIAAIARGARELEHGLLIFPEGHRTRDGEIGPFRAGGLLTMLEARRVPVYAVVGDGFWHARRLVDFALNIHRIRGQAEVLGPFQPPEDPADHEAFIAHLRDRMVERLHAMRAAGW